MEGQGAEMKGMIEQLLKKFKTAEEKKVEQTDKYKSWIKQIISDDFHLMEMLIKCAQNEKIDPKLKVGIYKIVRKLTVIEESRDKVINDLKGKKDFQKTLIDFVNSQIATGEEEIPEEPIALLFVIYSIEDFGSNLNENLVSTLLKCLSYLKDDDDLNGLFQFLIDLCIHPNEQINNLFIKCHSEADSNTFMVFNESILSMITNYSKEKNIDMFKKVIKCICNIMDKEETEILYRNDIETLFLSIQNELQLLNDIQIKVGYMEFLLRICRLDLFKQMFLRESDYEVYISDLQAFLQSEDLPGELKGLSIKVLDELNNK